MHFVFFFFFNDTATTEIYTLSLHDALPICEASPCRPSSSTRTSRSPTGSRRSSSSRRSRRCRTRSGEHTSELQSRQYLVCRLLLEKKKGRNIKSLKVLAHNVTIAAFFAEES